MKNISKDVIWALQMIVQIAMEDDPELLFGIRSPWAERNLNETRSPGGFLALGCSTNSSYVEKLDEHMLSKFHSEI